MADNKIKNKAPVKASTSPAAKGDVPSVDSEATVVNKEEALKAQDPVLKGRYTIQQAYPVASFTHAYADAYMAAEEKGGKTNYVAVVVKDRFYVRQENLSTIYNVSPETSVKIVDWGIVYWAAEEKFRFVIIFEKPEAEVLLSEVVTHREPMPVETMVKQFIPAMAYTIRDMSDRGVFHGNIRPENIFFDEKKGSVALLGDCFSSAPGCLQPVLYETIERAMADPIARGRGLVTDDIYALGATVAVLLRGHNPASQLTSAKIIDEKTNRGSYNFFVDGLKLDLGMSEFFRGTLTDDPKQRWGSEQLIAWVEGARLTTRIKALDKKANRAFEFNGQKYYRIRTLVRDFYKNPREVVTLIESGSLYKWLERSVGLQRAQELVTEAVRRASAGDKGTGYEQRLIAHLGLVLDPSAPIKFCGKSILPNGFIPSLHMAMIKDEDLKVYTEFLKHKLGWYWHSIESNAVSDSFENIRAFERASKVVSKTGLVEGMPRCLYDMNSEIPCMSSLVKDYFVPSPKHLLIALDHFEGEAGFSGVMDSHVASFILARDAKDQAGLLSFTLSNDKVKRNLAILTLFQNIQMRLVKAPLRTLAKKLEPMAMLVTERFNNQKIVTEVQEKIVKIVQLGDLSDLLKLIDDPLKVRKDLLEYQKSRNEYRELKEEHDAITTKLREEKTYGLSTGREITVIVSTVLAIVCVIGILLLKAGK